MPNSTSSEQALPREPISDASPVEPLVEDLHLAHSLRTPLTALKSAIDLLCLGELPEDGKRFATMAQRNAERMIELIEKLLVESSVKS